MVSIDQTEGLASQEKWVSSEEIAGVWEPSLTFRVSPKSPVEAIEELLSLEFMFTIQ